jgi:hypothetical protein
MLVGSCDKHIILNTSSDVFISNPGLRYEALFLEMYTWKGQITFEGHWRLQSWTLLGGYCGRLAVDICDGHLELVAQWQRTQHGCQSGRIVQQSRVIATWLWRAKGHSTHETETMWPFHFKHSHWWKKRSQSKFPTSYLLLRDQQREYVNSKMDVKSMWIPTWHQMDHVSWSLGLLSKTTSWR